MRRTLILAIGGVLALSACASDDTSDEVLPLQEDLPAASGQTQSSDEPIPVEPNGGIGDGTAGEELPVVSPDLSSEIEAALADLRERLGDDRLIEVVVAFELTWPTGALGCPQDGVAYTEALVDGYLIELSDGASTYAYHGALDTQPFLCVGSDDAQEHDTDSLGSDGDSSEDSRFVVPTTTP